NRFEHRLRVVQRHSERFVGARIDIHVALAIAHNVVSYDAGLDQLDGPHSGRRAAWLAVIPTRQVPLRAARRPASALCGAGDQLARPTEGAFTWQSPGLLQ